MQAAKKRADGIRPLASVARLLPKPIYVGGSLFSGSFSFPPDGLSTTRLRKSSRLSHRRCRFPGRTPEPRQDGPPRHARDGPRPPRGERWGASEIAHILLKNNKMQRIACCRQEESGRLRAQAVSLLQDQLPMRIVGKTKGFFVGPLGFLAAAQVPQTAPQHVVELGIDLHLRSGFLEIA